MVPNYHRAARKAAETMSKFGACAPDHILQILKQLPGVSVIALDIQSIPGHECWDAFSCVREKDGVRQYIVIYNQTLPRVKLNLALAREMAHIVLKHDTTVPEEIWSEEANCFAYHCICYQPVKRSINFRPKLSSLLWELKSIQSFESLDHLKAYVADEQTRYARAFRSGYHPADRRRKKNAGNSPGEIPNRRL